MMNDTKAKGLGEYASITFLDPHKSTFERTAGGFLALKVSAEESYPRVNLHMAFPFSYKNEFISVRDQGGKEIGVIRRMEDFDKETVALFEEQLERRYFAPKITSINSIKEEFSYSYWDVETDAGACRFTVKGGHSNVVALEDHKLLVTDVDGNRFEIADVYSLDSKSIRKLEVFL